MLLAPRHHPVASLGDMPLALKLSSQGAGGQRYLRGSDTGGGSCSRVCRSAAAERWQRLVAAEGSVPIASNALHYFSHMRQHCVGGQGLCPVLTWRKLAQSSKAAISSTILINDDMH